VDNFDTQLSQNWSILRAVLKKERRNWILPEPLRAQPGLEAFSPVFRQILHARGVVRQGQLDPWLQTDLERAPDPFLLKDMAVACDLIAQCVAAGERIAVYGDYDADGVTACVTLARGLRSVGAEVITYIPNRFTEGYGLNLDALNELHARGARLVITCDCGTNSVEAAAGRPRGGSRGARMRYRRRPAAAGMAPLLPGALDLLERLERKRVPRAIATSSGAAYVERVLRPHGVLDRFAFVLTGEDVTLGKPFPEVYEKAAARFGHAPAETPVLVVSPSRLRAAQAALVNNSPPRPTPLRAHLLAIRPSSRSYPRLFLQ